jgi:predicted nucleotidyltransferase
MNRAIRKVADAIVSVMDGKVRGIWLYGSTVLDDFRPGWSDIDFVALTDGPIGAAQAERLLTLRQTLSAAEPGNPFYRAFEGIIADADEYREKAFTRLVYWGTSGQRITGRYTPDAFSLFELAKYGKPIYGNSAWILPAPGQEALIGAVRSHYEAIRKYAVETTEALYSCGWLLDIARCIYTLRYHDVIAKTQAGIWALEEHLFSDETPLRKTIEIRQHPLSFMDREDIRLWLKGLGPTVQEYADALEQELQNISVTAE